MSAYVKRLADYDIERLTEAVDAMFTASAFYGRIKPHMTVILKPNLVMRSAPEEAIITHPNVTAAVAICLLRRGAQNRLRCASSSTGGSGWASRASRSLSP